MLASFGAMKVKVTESTSHISKQLSLHVTGLMYGQYPSLHAQKD